MILDELYVLARDLADVLPRHVVAAGAPSSDPFPRTLPLSLIAQNPVAGGWDGGGDGRDATSWLGRTGAAMAATRAGGERGGLMRRRWR